jgi:putative heme degradation protein
MSDVSSQLARDHETRLRVNINAKDCAKRARQTKAQLDELLSALEAMGYTIELNRKALRIHKEL